eukprot:evm.model.scf_468.4 EVM.evm.TU.scf_468.4   scf_468:21269-23999(-)
MEVWRYGGMLGCATAFALSGSVRRGEGLFLVRLAVLHRSCCADPKRAVGAVAAQFCRELSLPVGYEGFVEDQIQVGLRHLKNHQSFGGERRIKLEVYARLGELVFLDHVEWDLNNPYNTTRQYASQVCMDLGLGLDWFRAIDKEVTQLLTEARQSLTLKDTELPASDVLPALQQIRCEATAWGPRIEKYDPSNDLSAMRARLRQAAQQKRQAAKEKELQNSSKGSQNQLPSQNVKLEEQDKMSQPLKDEKAGAGRERNEGGSEGPSALPDANSLSAHGSKDKAKDMGTSDSKSMSTTLCCQLERKLDMGVQEMCAP